MPVTLRRRLVPPPLTFYPPVLLLDQTVSPLASIISPNKHKPNISTACIYSLKTAFIQSSCVI